MSRSAGRSPYVVSASPRAPLPALRMTRRGRLLFFIAIAALLLVAFSVGRVSSSAAVTGRPAAARTVVVAPGQSLWEIARRAVPGADPRAVVADLEQLNHLSAGTLRPGQRLVLPAP